MHTLKNSEPKSIPIIWEFMVKNKLEKRNNDIIKIKEDLKENFDKNTIFSGTLFQDKNKY